MAKKFQAVNILVSARVASKEEFENENPILELDCFAINKEGFETATVDNTSTTTSGVKLGDGVTAWVDLPYLTDVTASLVRSWLDFEQNAAKARLVTLPDTNFVYDLSEEFQNMVEENFRTNSEEHEVFNGRLDATDQRITDEIQTLNNRIDNEVQILNDRVDNEIETLNTRIDTEVKTLNDRVDTEVQTLNTYISNEVSRLDQKDNEIDQEITSLHEKDTELNEKFSQEVDLIKGRLTTNETNISTNETNITDLLARMETLEAFGPFVELIFAGGNASNIE